MLRPLFRLVHRACPCGCESHVHSVLRDAAAQMREPEPAGAQRKGGEEAAWERGCSDWPWLSQVWVCLFKRFASFKTISRYKSTLIEALHTPTTRTASTGSSAAARTPAHAPVSRHRPAQLHMDRARPLAVLVLNLKPVLQSPVLLQRRNPQRQGRRRQQGQWGGTPRSAERGRARRWPSRSDRPCLYPAVQIGFELRAINCWTDGAKRTSS